MKTRIILLVFIVSLSCAPDQRRVLNVSMSLAESEWKVFRKEIFPAFEKKHSCRIYATQIEAGDLPQILEAMHRSGKVRIDVFAQDNMQLSLLVSHGLVEELSAYEERIPGVVPRNLIEACKFQNILYFMPYRPNVQIVYYNKKKFSEYGLHPPRNWSELLQVAKTFKEQEGVGRVLLKAYGGAPTTTQIYEFIVSAGGDPLTLNDEGCLRTFQLLQKL